MTPGMSGLPIRIGDIVSDCLSAILFAVIHEAPCSMVDRCASSLLDCGMIAIARCELLIFFNTTLYLPVGSIVDVCSIV